MGSRQHSCSPTRDDFSNRERYTRMNDAMRALLHFGIIPIINENDTVAVDEIRVGDNDTLSAYVTNLAQAQLLVILSDPGRDSTPQTPDTTLTRN